MLRGCVALCDAHRRVASPVAFKAIAGVDSAVGAAVDSERELAATPRFDGFLRLAKCSGFLMSPHADSALLQHKIDSGTNSGIDSGTDSGTDSGCDARSVIHRSISGGNRSDTHTDNSLSRT